MTLRMLCGGLLLLLAGCRCAEEVRSAPALPAAPSVVAPKGPPPSAPQVLLREADAAFQAGNHALAIEKAQAVLELLPNHPLAWNLVGRAAAAGFASTGDAALANKGQEAFLKAYQASPSFWPALQNLAELHEKRGQLAEAATYYQKVLVAEPKHPDRLRFEKVISSASAAPPSPAKQ